MGDIFDQAAKQKPAAGGDIFDQAAAATTQIAPPPGTPSIKPPAFMGGPTTEGSSAGQSPLIAKAPEESGLETGPLVSSNPSENDTLAHGTGSARSIARTFHAAGQALNPVTQVPAMLHAAFDKPQDGEEMGAEAAGGPLGKFLYRTAVKPTTNAIQDYAAGRVTPEAAMNVGPEAIGNAGGTVIGGKLLDVLGGTAVGKPIGPELGLRAPRPLGQGPLSDLTSKTYSPTGDHISSALRSNTKVDVPAEAHIAAPAIEEGLNDRGITTKSFEGRNGPAALQSGIDNALDIHEARAKAVIDPIRGEAVPPEVLAKNPELAARFADKEGNLPKDLTYGKVDAERITMNKELRTSNFYGKPPSAQYAVGDPLANLHDAANQARDVVYDKAGEMTGQDLRPLKRTESALIKLGDLAETTKNTLSPKEAQFNSTSPLKRLQGTVQGILSVKANPVNAFSIPEKTGLFNPLNEFNSHLQKAFPDLQAATADRTMPFGYGHKGLNLNLTSGDMPPALQRAFTFDGGPENTTDAPKTVGDAHTVPGAPAAELTPSGQMPPETQRPFSFMDNPNTNKSGPVAPGGKGAAPGGKGPTAATPNAFDVSGLRSKLTPQWDPFDVSQLREKLLKASEPPTAPQSLGAAAAKVIDTSPEAVKAAVNPARDTDIMKQLETEHPDWDMGKRLREAAKITNPNAPKFLRDAAGIERRGADAEYAGEDRRKLDPFKQTEGANETVRKDILQRMKDNARKP